MVGDFGFVLTFGGVGVSGLSLVRHTFNVACIAAGKDSRLVLVELFSFR